MEKITIIGRVTKSPEMRYTSDGTPVTSFSVATSKKSSAATCPKGWKEGYKGKGWELTTFWRVTAWKGLAETINQYVDKGSQLYIEGELGGEPVDGVLNPRIWFDKDGTAHAGNEMTARSIEFLGSRGSTDTAADEQEPDEDDELPF